MLTKYGTDNIVVMLLISMIFMLAAIFFIKGWLCYPVFLLGFILFIFTFIFFRDPDRQVPEKVKESDAYILSGADGRVVEIIEENEDVFLKEKAIRISIFLSPLNVHVNRSPATGTIKYFKYFPGDYLVATHPKSSEKNEQTHIGIENSYGKVLFKQIVGILARRLVWDIKEGDYIKAGERFGMMKFGSRMDIILPADSQILIKLNDKLTAGETIVAVLKN